MKYARIAFLVADQDPSRNIYGKEFLWFYLPPLCRKLENAKPALLNTEGMKCLLLSFVVGPRNLTPYQMPWLVGLLHEFCCSETISTSSTLSKGNIGGIETRIELKDDQKCEVSIFWSPSNQSDTSHVANMASNILEVIETSLILSEFLKLWKIQKIDETGKVEALFDINKAVKMAIDDCMKTQSRLQFNNI